MSKHERKYVIYARQSSSGQDEDSVNRQIRHVRDLLVEDDAEFVVPDVEHEPESRDGNSENRPQS